MPEGQFLYDRNGRPLLAPAPPPPPPVHEPTGELNAKCPTCGNRYTSDLPMRNTSGKSQVTSKKVRCDDCDTTFEAPLEEPIVPKYQRRFQELKRPVKRGK